MSSGWKKVNLVEHLEAIIDYRGKTPKKSEKGIRTLSAKSVKTGKILYEEAFFISEETYKKFMVRGFPKKGDVLMTTEAPLGCVARLDNDDVGLAQRLITLRGKQNVLDNGYLLYFLMSRLGQHELLARATGTTVQGIKRSEFEKVNIILPPLPEQKAIAHILGTLDDKIELNRKMNETLEQMARALFKSWFVDFDPVMDNAIAAGNPIPDALKQKAEQRKAVLNSGKYKPLSDELLSMFPSAFVYSEELDKWIPEGWEVSKVSDLADVNCNSWSSKNKPVLVEYVDLGNTKLGNIQETITYKYEEAPSRAKRILSTNDTIIATVRPGNKGYAFILEEGLTGSTGFAVLTPKHVFYRAIVYLFLTSEENIDLLAHLADGGAYPAINPSVIMDLSLLNCNACVDKAFDELVFPMFSKIQKNKLQNKTLADKRDALLPQLIGGKLRVQVN